MRMFRPLFRRSAMLVRKATGENTPTEKLPMIRKFLARDKRQLGFKIDDFQFKTFARFMECEEFPFPEEVDQQAQMIETLRQRYRRLSRYSKNTTCMVSKNEALYLMDVIANLGRLLTQQREANQRYRANGNSMFGY